MAEKEAEKKRSLRNEKLEANRTSATEEQRKERLRIKHEKDRARRRTKGYFFFLKTPKIRGMTSLAL